MATIDTLGLQQLVPQQQNPSISEFIAPQTFQPIVTRFTGSPEISDNISALDSKFQQVDEATDELGLLKASIDRLDVDNPYVKEELAKYDVAPELVNDPYASAKIRQKALQFKAELKDPTSVIGAAQMNYNAEKQMEKQLNTLVATEKISSDEGKALMDNYRNTYRAMGGVKDSQGMVKAYPLFQNPATRVDGIKLVNDAVSNWAKNTHGSQVARAYPTKDGKYIVESKDGSILTTVNAELVQKAIEPVLRSHTGFEAYNRQKGKIQTFGKSDSQIKQELLLRNEGNTAREDIINSATTREQFERIAEEFSYEDAIAHFTRLGVDKTKMVDDRRTQDRSRKESSHWAMMYKAGLDREASMGVLFGASGTFTKSYKAGEIHTKIAENNKENANVGKQIEGYLKSKGSEYSLPQVLKLYELPHLQDDFILNQVFKGDQDLANLTQQYYQSKKRNDAVMSNYDRVATKGGFNPDIVIDEAKFEMVNSGYVDTYMGNNKLFTKQDLLKSIKKGLSYEEFLEDVVTNSKNEILKNKLIEVELIPPKTGKDIDPMVRKLGRTIKPDSPLENLYDEVMVEYQTSAQKGYAKGIDKQYTLYEGTGGKDNFYNNVQKGYQELITSGAQELRDNTTGQTGDYQMILGKALGMEDEKIRTVEFTNLEVVMTSDIGFEDKPVVVIKGTRADGNIAKVPVVLEGKGAYTNILNMIEEGMRNLGGIDESHITKTQEEAMKQYLGASLRGGYQQAGLEMLGTGQSGTVKLPDGRPFVSVERTSSGYRVSMPNGQRLQTAFPSLEALQAGLGMMLWRNNHKPKTTSE